MRRHSVFSIARLYSSSSKIRVYTRTGDKGNSSLYSGERRSKSDDIFSALGAADELNAHIGVAVTECRLHDGDVSLDPLIDMLTAIQSRLFDIGSVIATPPERSSEKRLKRVELSSGMVDALEGSIDMLDEECPELTNFILPGNGTSRAAAALQVSRAVCRRLERLLVALRVHESHIDDDPELCKYINRLSDFLFVAARWTALKQNSGDIVYQKD